MEENENLDPIYKDNALTKPRTYPRMKKRMKRIVQYIENQLGGQVLDLELTPEQIKQIVKQSFEEIVHYMTDTYTVTVPYNVKLEYNNLFKRVEDGKIFRVTSDSVDVKTPSVATFSFKQVTAEEYVGV